jgi:hypothetical protein
MDLLGAKASVKEAIDGLTNQVIPAEQKAIAGAVLQLTSMLLDVVDHLTYAGAGLTADVANRIEGATVPIRGAINVDLQIGPIKLTRPDYEVSK